MHVAYKLAAQWCTCRRTVGYRNSGNVRRRFPHARKDGSSAANAFTAERMSKRFEVRVMSLGILIA
jgi:hypothetical protein